ncbi:MITOCHONDRIAL RIBONUCLEASE P PROTEIN 3 [Plasmopara halstedii]|uniref:MITOCHONDRIAL RIBONUCLEASE P PROTEIN 3 n=1 Tax=Plasmopara halstedii TaxID=4781 RepID=A0A0P1AAV0_PLAHL|nr:MITOCHONDRIAL RIBONUCLEASE P PROTEIN 3 [Plasmopara halstedii]CEG37489.1 MITOCHONDRIAL RIBONUCLEASE P PROTEIN 3 [Plasmopara halstedii]|eukprot:XP_024573858.1 MITOCHONDRIAL RIBONUCLEASE P PROTEIN 3 [Plasmopara halstedii]
MWTTLHLPRRPSVLSQMMQRLSCGLDATVRPRRFFAASSRVVLLPSALNSSINAVNLRVLSVARAAPKLVKPGRIVRRRKQLLFSTLQNAHEDPGLIKKSSKRSKFFVHECIVQQGMPLEDVLPLIKNEIRAKTLRATMTRQAVDSFYFYCAQYAAERKISDRFRRQVLQYFDNEIFVYNDEQATESFILGKTLNEAVFCSVIKLHLAGGDLNAAWLLLEKLRHAVRRSSETMKLHFRTVSPYLEHECKHGDFLSAYVRWQQLKQHDVEWTSAMEDVLVQIVVACVNHEHRVNQYIDVPSSKASEVPFHVQMTSLLHDLQLTCREVSMPNAQSLVRAFRSAGYSVDTVPSDHRMRPQCPSCGHALKKQGLTKQECAQMLIAIESRHSKFAPEKTIKEFLDPFRDWLKRRHEAFKQQSIASDEKSKKLHYVLDGPNIAYINQNFEAGTYRLDQVDAVAKHLQAEGHFVSITMPANYLADKFLVRVRNNQTRHSGKFAFRGRTDEEKDILARWRQEDLIYSCRTDFLSDDLFWLYASVILADDGRVVTNDQGRDHVFALLNGFATTKANARTQKNGKKSLATVQAEIEQPGVISFSMDLIARWKEMTIVNVEIKHNERAVKAAIAGDWKTLLPIESIKLHHPLPFSRVPQVTALRHFHFPITMHANQNEHPNQVQSQRKGTQWLCVHQLTQFRSTLLHQK